MGHRIRVTMPPSAIVVLSLLMANFAFAGTLTTTTLTISPSGSVAAGTVVTLTAAVAAASMAVTPGLVTFCKANALHCEDTAILGQAQLTSAGSATVKLRLGIGPHSIKAIFAGTTSLASSTSLTESVTVTGLHATTTALAVSGTAPAYTFKGTITAAGASAPTGILSFEDANHGNVSLGSVPLSAASAIRQFVPGSPLTLTGALSSPGGDFNGDGIPDLVALDTTHNVAPVLLGKGDGTFKIKSSPATGAIPVEVVVADFNSDGIPDIAVANLGSSNVTVLLGNGDGTFTNKSSPPVGNSPYAITSGDYNNDGIPDLVTVSANDNTASILLGNGDGTFTLKSSPAVATYPLSVTTADFNRDGIPDLAVASEGLIGTILLGNGDGTFTLKSSPSVGNYPGAILSADFNDDGIPDLMTVNADDSVNPITYLIGVGDGTFTPQPSPNIGLFPSLVAIGDFNNDGVADLAAANHAVLTVLAGQGDGTFVPLFSTALTSSFEPATAVVQDFNGDGAQDLALWGGSTSPKPLIETTYLSQLTSVASTSAQLSPGSYQVIASYSGDTSYAASSSQPFPISLPPATPVFAPRPGIYQWTQTVTITDATPGAVIYYTLDGTTPSTSSTKYTSPIAVSWGATIMAIAALNGANSAVASATYTIDRPLPAPIFSLPSGSYSAPQAITLTVDPTYCDHAVCPIYYTLNGGTPNTGSRLYTGPITLSSPGANTIEAIGTSSHFEPSPVAAATYTLH